ncbi:MAG: PEP-CTERM sorting domain-containing protein, partial [Kiritimatiellae bacterium]|nr:PEP-CTERM sorting domain-containing protein [Kiritimatiellia bacterium]
ADYLWYYGDTSVETLQAQTGQSSGGAGLQVSWEDTTLRVYNPNAPDNYGSGTLSIQQNRSIPTIYNHALISFDDLFGSAPGQIGSTNAFRINQATLWLHADAQEESFTLSLAGLAAPNAGWDKNTATFNTIDGENEWSGGTFSESLHGHYGSYTTVVQGAASWIGIDITLALQAYQNELISGIALIAPSALTSEIRGLYADANDSENILYRPGVFVDLVAIPEPATGGFLLLGGLLCWVARRRRSVAVALALSCSGIAQAETSAWIGSPCSAGTPTTTDAEREIVTDWKDAQIDPNACLNAACGLRDEIGVISPRTIPPLQSIVLFSFNELFAPNTDEGLPRSVVLEEATLWLYITQAVGLQDVALCGVDPADRDWDAALASAAEKNNQPWSGNTLDRSLTQEYGRFRSPTRTGWFQIPVDLSAALRDYRAGLIGGIALRPLAIPENRLCNFYFHSGRSADLTRHPALHVQYHPQPEAPTIRECWLELQAETGQPEAHIHAPEADAVLLRQDNAAYAFGGHWTFPLPFANAPGTYHHSITLQGITNNATESLTETAQPEPIDIHTDGHTLHLSWSTSADAWYQILQSDNLAHSDWKQCPAFIPAFGGGNPLACSYTPNEKRGYYRLLAHRFAWNSGGQHE